MPLQTAYQIFGVPHTAHIDDITRSWKALMKRFHPDLVKHTKGRELTEAEKKENLHDIQEINRAYSILKDPVQRQKYDQAIAQEQAQRMQPQPMRVPVVIIMTGANVTSTTGSVNFTGGFGGNVVWQF